MEITNATILITSDATVIKTPLFPAIEFHPFTNISLGIISNISPVRKSGRLSFFNFRQFPPSYQHVVQSNFTLPIYCAWQVPYRINESFLFGRRHRFYIGCAQAAVSWICHFIEFDFLLNGKSIRAIRIKKESVSAILRNYESETHLIVIPSDFTNHKIISSLSITILGFGRKRNVFHNPSAPSFRLAAYPALLIRGPALLSI
mgnify:CR=1 FL=1